MLFDTHIHVFPEKLVGKVLPKLAQISRCNYYRDESLNSAIKSLSAGGGTHGLTLHIATNANQMQAVNDFAAKTQGKNIYSFGSVHPRAENAIAELKRIKEMGLKGIKLHPDYQGFMADSKEMENIYRTCNSLGLIVAFHTGLDPYSPHIVHCSPLAIKNIANGFSGLKIIAAHMGGMNRLNQFEKHLAGTDNVYIDTAMASSFVSPNQMRRLSLLHGVDKVLFATDSPWSTIENEKMIIENSGLTVEEKSAIYFDNAMNLLK